MFFVKNPFFESLMEQAGLPVHPILVVGVSGGADSLYLTFLLNDWVKKHKGHLYAVTVDHQLRPESSREAETVHDLLFKHHIPHQTLVWTGIKPTTRIEEKAREKRYQLLLDYCQKQKADALCLAHHQEDQAETFLLRLARSSTVKGLSAMRVKSKRDGVILLRPLLTTSKKMILDTLKTKHISWIEDQMNYNSDYERVRWRNFQPQLTQMGLTPAVIQQTTFRIARADDALTFYTHKFIRKNVHFAPENYVSFPLDKFIQEPIEIQIRLIDFLISSITLKEKAISLKSIEKIVLNIPKYATLGGCQLVVKKDTIFIAKEAKYLPQTMPFFRKKWTSWGSYHVFSMIDGILSAKAPKKRIPNIPYLIQKTFPNAGPDAEIIFMNPNGKSQKELEKSFIMDYKNHNNAVYLIQNKETL